MFEIIFAEYKTGILGLLGRFGITVKKSSPNEGKLNVTMFYQALGNTRTKNLKPFILIVPQIIPETQVMWVWYYEKGRRKNPDLGDSI